MDSFRARLHVHCCCGGGIECTADRPFPHSSAGNRRKTRANVRARRNVRAEIKENDRKTNFDSD